MSVFTIEKGAIDDVVDELEDNKEFYLDDKGEFDPIYYKEEKISEYALQLHCYGQTQGLDENWLIKPCKINEFCEI